MPIFDSITQTVCDKQTWVRNLSLISFGLLILLLTISTVLRTSKGSLLNQDTNQKADYSIYAVLVAILIICRSAQWVFLYTSLQHDNKNCKLGPWTILFMFVTHFSLWNAVHQLNYAIYGRDAFNFPGGPAPSPICSDNAQCTNVLEETTVKGCIPSEATNQCHGFIASETCVDPDWSNVVCNYDGNHAAFEQSLNTNLAYFTFTTSSTVGYGDITPKSTFGKIAVMFQMLDAACLMGVMIGRFFESLSGDEIAEKEKYSANTVVPFTPTNETSTSTTENSKNDANNVDVADGNFTDLQRA
jgi:hypothetical protein